MEQLLKNINFSMLPTSQDLIVFGDNLVLYGNFNTTVAETLNEEIQAFQSNLPKRILFTLVLICKQGRVTLSCNLKQYTLEDGSLLAITPNTIIESVDIDSKSIIVCLGFSDDSYAPSLYEFDSAFNRSNFFAPVQVLLDSKILDELSSIYHHLRCMLTDLPEVMSPELVKSYTKVLSGLVSYSLKEQVKTQKNSMQNVVEKIFEDFLSNVASNYLYHRDVAFYADKACLSPKYYAKIIFKQSGRHPLDWIRDYVILEAKTQLRSDYSTIQQVSDYLHFPSISHFGRYFRAAVGISPSEYKKR